MLKPKKIILLWLLLSMVAFLSCGDINDVIDFDLYLLQEQNVEISHLDFVKFYCHPGSNYPLFGEIITECMVGDSIALVCSIYGVGNNALDNYPTLIIARLNTSKGKVRSVKLSNRIGTYTVPPFPYSICFPEVPFYNRYNRHKEASITQNTDVITAIVKGKNQTLTTTLNIRSK